jgi:hypothetical protein
VFVLATEVVEPVENDELDVVVRLLDYEFGKSSSRS